MILGRFKYFIGFSSVWIVLSHLRSSFGSAWLFIFVLAHFGLFWIVLDLLLVCFFLILGCFGLLWVV